jgi:hypothetical protein
MKFTISEGKFGVPVGHYQTRFLGAHPRVPQPGQQPLLGRDGQPMPPGLEWQFEVLGGEYAGKVTSRTTGQDASPKNACGRMLADITGQPVWVGVEIDITPYVGRPYQVRVGQNPNSDGTRVETVMPVGNTAPPVNHPGNGHQTLQEGLADRGPADAAQVTEVKRLFGELPTPPSPELAADLRARAGIPQGAKTMNRSQAAALIQVLNEHLGATVEAVDNGIPF